MFSHGGDGQVYVWDMDTRACVHTFVDEGCFNGTALTVSKDSRLLATGCVMMSRETAVFFCYP
jgi:U3 small nucleolar RNA-associated protein 18